MKLRVLGCSGGSIKGRHLSCFLLNDSIALDAGSLTHALTLEQQRKVRHIVISHSHLDHNCGLPFLADNVLGKVSEPIVVYATRAVVTGLRKHMFNDVLWPDFTRLPSRQAPTLRFQEIQDGQPFTIDHLTLTPVSVNHITPTVGFVVEDSRSAILYTSDTGPTELVWEVANRTPKLRAIITEASFSNEEEGLAVASGHLTPELLDRELEKLGGRARLLITHIKPSYRSSVVRQLRQLGRQKLELLQHGRTYRF